jgi:hypothetical protein
MKTGSAKSVRCAIYTRVSSDQGLEQDFNRWNGPKFFGLRDKPASEVQL